ncbi:MAG: PRC-barrel domain-containing protein [Hyphomicrobium sp.]|jgi:glucose/arabinose dehydrogenase
MTARISLVALLAVMAGSAFAQEPSTAPPTTENAPSMQSDQMAPSTTPAPQAPAATEPTPAAPATTMDKEAAAPAPSGDVAANALKKAEDDAKMVPQLNASVDSVEEMDIFDANGKKIAEVDSVLEDSTGEVKGVAIEYGGFLGFGEKGAIVTFDQLKAQDGKLTTTLTEEQLPTLPAWND